jgi:hypothetical protein
MINKYMNYSYHYQSLVTKAKTRILDDGVYVERHHIFPKCLGGDNSSDNIVELTPEEHFTAHLLLIKIYPNSDSLVYAAMMMCSGNKFHGNGLGRSNKLYGWLKRKHLTICKQRLGEKNGAFGTRWVTDGTIAKKIKKTDSLPAGFVEGRIKKDLLVCRVCGIQTSFTSSYCDEHRHRRKDTNPSEVLAMYEAGAPMNEILEKYGWKTEQNVTTFLSKNFPKRKKFLPKKRLMSS